MKDESVKWVYEDDMAKVGSVEPIAAPRSTLEELSKRDYKGVNYFPKEYYAPVVDPDSYETMLQRGTSNQDCSMDAALYIPKSKTWLLVELRLGYTNCENLSFTEMDGKVSHTKTLLLPTACGKECYFIFKENIASRAQRTINNLLKEKNRTSYQWNVCSPRDFCNQVVGISKMPIRYIHSEEEIIASLDSKLGNWNAFLNQVDFWKQKGQRYLYGGKKSEKINIYKVVSCYLEKLIASNAFSEIEDATEYLEIYKEDFI